MEGDETWVGGMLRDVADVTRDQMPVEEMQAVADSMLDLREKLEELDMTREQAVSGLGSLVAMVFYKMMGEEDDERDST